MRRSLSLLAIVILLTTQVVRAGDSDEITLFSANGKPVAYIADDLTIYLWSGKPVAYLSTGENHDGANVYGFNGKHLGWFVRGVIRDHDGNAACGVRSVVSSPQSEPFKSFKQFKPFKAFKEFVPSQPSFTKSWSDTPCLVTLALGAED